MCELSTCRQEITAEEFLKAAELMTKLSSEEKVAITVILSSMKPLIRILKVQENDRLEF